MSLIYINSSLRGMIFFSLSLTLQRTMPFHWYLPKWYKLWVYRPSWSRPALVYTRTRFAASDPPDLVWLYHADAPLPPLHIHYGLCWVWMHLRGAFSQSRLLAYSQRTAPHIFWQNLWHVGHTSHRRASAQCPGNCSSSVSAEKWRDWSKAWGHGPQCPKKWRKGGLTSLLPIERINCTRRKDESSSYAKHERILTTYRFAKGLLLSALYSSILLSRYHVKNDIDITVHLPKDNVSTEKKMHKKMWENPFTWE